MAFYQMDLVRIVQVYVVQVIIAIIFIFLAYKILKRDRKRLNFVFSGLYVFTAIGLVINCIYAPITDESIVLILNFITNFTTAFGTIFLTTFSFIIWFSEKRFTKTKQNVYISIYGILLFLSIIFVPNGGLIINEETNWKPVWSFQYYFYFISVLTLIAAIPFVYTSLKIYFDFKDLELKKKWLFFMIGAFGLYLYMYMAYTANYLNNPLFRLILSVFGLSVVLWVYLMYFGVGKQLEK